MWSGIGSKRGAASVLLALAPTVAAWGQQAPSGAGATARPRSGAVRVAVQPVAPQVRSRVIVTPARPAAARKPKRTRRAAVRVNRAVTTTPVRPTSSRRASTPRRTAPRPTAVSMRGMGRRGAFSPAPMRSRQDLIRQLRASSGFRRNLSRHFGVAEAELETYILENVKFTTLDKPLRSDVYAVSRTGRIFKVRQRIPKGTPVFALYDGNVMLKAVCSNPIVPGLLPVPTSVKPITSVAPPREVQVPFPPTGSEEQPITPGFPPLSAYAPPITDSVPPSYSVVAPQEYFAPPAATTPGFTTIAGGRPFPFWLAAAGIPFFFLGGSSGSTPRIPPPLIPEPASMALFATGVLPVLAMARRRRRQPREDADA